MKKFGLSNNQLKILAMISMLCDHVGLSLLPQLPILRILGRLAMPIFAYMIAEGCRYTHNRKRYFGQLFGLAMVCQLVYFFAMGSVYQSILVTFSLSVLMIFSIDHFMKKKDLYSGLLAAAVVSAVALICLVLPGLLPDTDFQVDYGFWGVLLPVAVFLAPTKLWKLLSAATVMILLSWGGGIQWYCLLTLPLLALYNGQRGKWRIKYLFYIFYPVHLVVIYLIGLLLV